MFVYGIVWKMSQLLKAENGCVSVSDQSACPWLGPSFLSQYRTQGEGGSCGNQHPRTCQQTLGAGLSLLLGAGLCAESCSMSLTRGAGCEHSTRLLWSDLWINNLRKELGAVEENNVWEQIEVESGPCWSCISHLPRCLLLCKMG